MTKNSPIYLFFCIFLHLLTYGASQSDVVDVELARSGECVLPPKTDDNYRVVGCDVDKTSEELPDARYGNNALVESNTVLEFTCSGGRIVRSICFNGIWAPPPTCSNCGKTFKHFTETVDNIRTKEVTEALHPWQVVLYNNVKNTTRIFCGGSMISPRFVLTSAICLYSEETHSIKNITSLYVVIGKIDWSWNKSELNEQRRKVKSIKIQPRFAGMRNNYLDDVGIIELDKPFAITSFAMPVCLNWTSSTEYDIGVVGMILSWKDEIVGKDLDAKTMIPHTLYTVSQAECRKQIAKPNLMFLTHDKICATRFRGVEYINRGSLGNPFTLKFHGRHVLYASVALKFTNDNDVLVLNNLSTHHEFIEKFTQKKALCQKIITTDW